MTGAHNHPHNHRECSTPPPPPGTVDLEQLKQKAEAEAQRKRAVAAGSADNGEGIPPVVQITGQNLEAEVVLRSEEVPVVVLIGAEGAPDYTRMKSDLSELAQASGLHWILGLVDAHSAMEVAQAFGVQALPTLVAVAGGGPIGQAEGEQTGESLSQWIQAVLDATKGRLRGLPPGTRMEGEAGEQEPVEAPPVSTDPRLAEAEALLNDGSFDEAVTVYDAILKSEPANTELKAARTNVAFLARVQKMDRGVDHVAASNQDPTDVAAALAAADQLMLIGEANGSLDRLVSTLPKVFGDDRNAVRDRLLEMLQMFDPSDPAALDARRRMASALF